MFLIILFCAILFFVWYYKNNKVHFANQNNILKNQKKINYYTIALLAKIAKSDGIISQEEAQIISDILNSNVVDKEEKEFLKQCFKEYKNNNIDAHSIAKEFMREVPLSRSSRINILRLFIFVADVDGDLIGEKLYILKSIAKAFNITDFEFLLLLKHISNKNHSKNKKDLTLNKAYEILNLNSNANINEVKKQYRNLAKKYHPDILNANKVSQNELQKGIEKFRQINEAYEIIKKHLGA